MRHGTPIALIGKLHPLLVTFRLAYYRGSRIQLDGNEAPHKAMVDLRSAPAGVARSAGLGRTRTRVVVQLGKRIGSVGCSRRRRIPMWASGADDGRFSPPLSAHHRFSPGSTVSLAPPS
jgi:hypothetical protein